MELPVTREAAAKLLLFGATGDLSQRMLLPSLYDLHADGLLPDGLTITGTARSEHDDASFRAFAATALETFLPEDRKAQRYEQVAQISRRLKLMARDLEIPVVAAAQLNRVSEQRSNERPKLSDLRESGSIEQDADTVMLLHRCTEQGAQNTVEVNIAKQRNGPTGCFRLVFVKEYTRFENYAGAEV